MASTLTKLGLVTAAAALCLAAASGAKAADVATVAAACGNCHGKDGASTDPNVPIIGGVSSTYLAGQMAAYKKKERPCASVAMTAGDKKGTKSDMCEALKDLGDADFKQLGDYFAKLKFVHASQTADAALAAKGQQIHKQDCEKCHSSNGGAPDDDAGILAGQWMPYMKLQITQFKSDIRKGDPKMKPVLDRLDAASVDALLNFYASVK